MKIEVKKRKYTMLFNTEKIQEICNEDLIFENENIIAYKYYGGVLSIYAIWYKKNKIQKPFTTIKELEKQIKQIGE